MNLRGKQTQQEIADTICVSLRTVKALEKDTSKIKFETVEKYAIACGYTVCFAKNKLSIDIKKQSLINFDY